MARDTAPLVNGRTSARAARRHKPLGGTPIALMILATLAVAASSVFAQGRGIDPIYGGVEEASAEERFRWGGEEIYYNMEFRGSLAARAALSTGSPQQTEEWGRAIPIEALANSTGFFATIYPMRNTGLTWVDPETGRPFQSEKVIEERSSRRVYDVTYRGDQFRADIRRVRDDRTNTFQRHMPEDIHDGFSWIYDIRSRDLSVGTAYVYYVYDGWRLSRLTMRVVSHGELYTTGLGMLDVATFEMEREVFDTHHPLPWATRIALLPPVFETTLEPYTLATGWISLDERRIPVGVEVNTTLGVFRVVASRHVPPSE